ncbi:MAG TPA: hypothetical protein PJ982_10710, partial [Lacipirellulaceae bacterium]|nr:hypothetical protein [Lacipirellulaceae bacterium]
GGANYGNTIVLGQELLPHLAPSGLALATLALVATEQPLHNLGPRLRKLTAYLADSLDDAPPQSLSWALIGLTLAGLRPADAEERIAEALV